MNDLDIDIIVARISKDVEKHLIERGDERYVMQSECSEKQEKVNKMFANDDKRIEIIVHDFKIIKWLLTVLAGASGGSLITALIELFLK